jgi:hypothetical protein
MRLPHRFRHLSGLLIIVAAITDIAVTTGPASAAPVPPGRLTLTAATQSFTSSTGKPLAVDLTAVPNALTVKVSTPGQPETHTWSFPFANSSEISYDDDTGMGAVSTGTALRPYGAVALSLTAVGPLTVVGCGSTRVDQQQVTVNGTFAFATHTAWGTVGSRAPRSFTGTSILTIADPSDKLCGSTLPPCVVTSVWEAHNIASDLKGFTQFVGTSTTVGTTTTSSLLATRLSYLATPSGATRTDSTTLAVPNPTFVFADPSATVDVESGGVDMTGSARLAGTSENPGTPLACGDGQHRTTNSQWLATYTNGSVPLTVHEQVEGDFRLVNVPGESNRANATIERTLTTSA